MNAIEKDRVCLDRKSQLIQSARSLFAKKGYAATSVKDIASLADVNVALIHYHFGNKEGLYKSCLEDFAAEKMQFLQKYIFEPTSIEDFRFKLKMFIEEILQNEMENPEAGCIIRRDVESEDPIVLEIFRKTILNVFNAFVSFIESAQKRNFIRKDLDAQIVASLFMGGIQHEIRSEKVKKVFYGRSFRNKKYREELVETALVIFFNGVQNEK